MFSWLRWPETRTGIDGRPSGTGRSFAVSSRISAIAKGRSGAGLTMTEAVVVDVAMAGPVVGARATNVAAPSTWLATVLRG